MQQTSIKLWHKLWCKMSSPMLILIIVASLWLFNYALFYGILEWNGVLSLYLSLLISVVGGNLSLMWAKRYLEKQGRSSSVPHRITSQFYIPTCSDPNAFMQIVGMEEAIEVLKDALELPLKHPDLVKHFAIKSVNGLLLHGAPGNGKTALIRAASSYFGVNLFLVNGSAITSQHVGSTEKAIREVFAEAKANAPSLVFIDEIDSLGRRRDDQHLNRPSDLALNTLLTELDGFVSREGVFVVGATNRIDVLDEALLRPGRFTTKIEIKPPNREGRIAMFRFFSKGMPIKQQGIEWGRLADYTEGWTGAYIEDCVQRAARNALKRSMATNTMELIIFDDFIQGLSSRSCCYDAI